MSFIVKRWNYITWKRRSFHTLVWLEKCRNWSIVLSVFSDSTHSLFRVRNAPTMTLESLNPILFVSPSTSKQCQDNPANENKCDMRTKKCAVCCHLSTRMWGKYALYIPPETIVVDYIPSPLAFEMFGLDEKPILQAVNETEKTGFNIVLISYYAQLVYETVGFKHPPAVNKLWDITPKLWDTTPRLNSIQTIEVITDQCSRNREYVVKYQQWNWWDGV